MTDKLLKSPIGTILYISHAKPTKQQKDSDAAPKYTIKLKFDSLDPSTGLLKTQAKAVSKMSLIREDTKGRISDTEFAVNFKSKNKPAVLSQNGEILEDVPEYFGGTAQVAYTFVKREDGKAFINLEGIYIIDMEELEGTQSGTTLDALRELAKQ